MQPGRNPTSQIHRPAPKPPEGDESEKQISLLPSGTKVSMHGLTPTLVDEAGKGKREGTGGPSAV